MMAIRNPKDFWSGTLFVAIGVATIVIGSKYTLGTAARMGPGYFPRILGILLIVLGGILALRATRTTGGPMPRFHWRPLCIVLGSVVLFGLTVVPLGLVLSTILLIVVASTASHEFRWKEATIASVLLAGFVVVAFGYGLKLQLPILPPFLGNGG
jgi:hypothetical protein